MRRLKRFACSLLSHKWRSVKVYSGIRGWEKFNCNRCGTNAILDHSTKEFFEWNQKLEDIGNERYVDKVSIPNNDTPQCNCCFCKNFRRLCVNEQGFLTFNKEA